MDPQFRFCTSADGTRIAYAIYGSGPPVLLVKNIFQSLDARFTFPESRAHLDALAPHVTLITFDTRGTGASTRDVDDLSLEAQASDIATVAKAAGLRSFTLFAEGHAKAACAHYVIAHEKRIDRLVFWGAVGGNYAEDARAMRHDWSYARRVQAGRVYPMGPVSLQRAFNTSVKDTLTGEMAARYLEALIEVDFAALMRGVEAPGLVLQRERIADSWPTARESTIRLAGSLHNSQLRFVAGNAAQPYPDHAPVVQALLEFMGLTPPTGQIPEEEAAQGHRTSRFRTILFTDIAGHTEMMHRLGDAKGRDALREHERITREALKQHRGDEVKTDGDSFMASFASAWAAVECAVALQRSFAEYSTNAAEPILVRMGIHAGEPIEENDDLFGSSVIMASRIEAQAAGGEILVSDVVRSLLSGKGFTFADRGEFVPKGFEEPVRLYEVRWSE